MPNFNFLALLVSEMCRGSQNKNWGCWSPQTPPSGQVVTWSYSTCKWHTKFQLSSYISFWDKEGAPKFNVMATSPLPYPVRCNFYVCFKYLSRSNSPPNFNIVSLCIMQLFEYVFAIGFPLYRKMGFWGFWGWRCKILCSNPHKALPCVNTRLLVYRLSKSVQQPKL